VIADLDEIKRGEFPKGGVWLAGARRDQMPEDVDVAQVTGGLLQPRLGAGGRIAQHLVDLIDDLPGEDVRAVAPARDRITHPVLEQLAGRGVEEHRRRAVQRATVRDVERIVGPRHAVQGFEGGARSSGRALSDVRLVPHQGHLQVDAAFFGHLEQCVHAPRGVLAGGVISGGPWPVQSDEPGDVDVHAGIVGTGCAQFVQPVLVGEDAAFLFD